MDFKNKKNKNLMIDLKDSGPKTIFNSKNPNPETSKDNSLNFIDFSFDDSDSNLDDNNYKSGLNHLKEKLHEKSPDPGFNIELEELDDEFNFKIDKRYCAELNNESKLKYNLKSDDFDDEFNSYDGLCGENKPFIDVRIITGDLTKAEILSKSIKYLDLKTELDIVISAIIPVDNIRIVVNAVRGADIVLITDGHDFDNYNEILNDSNSGFREYNKINEVEEKTDYYSDKLKDIVGYVGTLKFPKTKNYDVVPKHFLQDEIKKSIMKAGLNSIYSMVELNRVNQELDLKNREVFKFLKLNEKLNVKNNFLINEYNTVKNENNGLKKDIKTLNIQIDELKSDFSDFKNRFSNIHNKDILEIFSLSQLWEDSFNEALVHEDHVVLATDKFKPDNIILGQGLIGAISKIHGVEWLKIVRTSLIFINNHPNLLDDFKNENHAEKPFISNESTSQEITNGIGDKGFNKEDGIFF